jgi:hypothetical protein
MGTVLALSHGCTWGTWGTLCMCTASAVGWRCQVHVWFGVHLWFGVPCTGAEPGVYVGACHAVRFAVHWCCGVHLTLQHATDAMCGMSSLIQLLLAQGYTLGREACGVCRQPVHWRWYVHAWCEALCPSADTWGTWSIRHCVLAQWRVYVVQVLCVVLHELFMQ